MLSLPLKELISEKFQALSDQILLEKAKELFQCMMLSNHLSVLVENAKPNLSECTEW